MFPTFASRVRTYALRLQRSSNHLDCLTLNESLSSHRNLKTRSPESRYVGLEA